MRAAIVDDEINSLKLLLTMLTDYCEGVVVVGTASDAASAVTMLRETEPDILFLDIELPGGDGLAVLDAFPEPGFKVVFVTGYDPYGLEDLARSALDWIEKPVDMEKLRALVEDTKVHLPTGPQQLELLRELRNPDQAREVDSFILTGGNQHERIFFAEVLYVEANGAYAFFHLGNGETRLASYSLAHYQQILPEERFFRVHRGYMVNGACVKQVDRGRGGNLILNSGAVLPIATRRKGAFMSFLRDLQASA